MYRLFTLVLRVGGFDAAGDFHDIATKLGFELKSAPLLKKTYQRVLLDFEQNAARPEMRTACDVCNTDDDEHLLVYGLILACDSFYSVAM